MDPMNRKLISVFELGNLAAIFYEDEVLKEVRMHEFLDKIDVLAISAILHKFVGAPSQRDGEANRPFCTKYFLIFIQLYARRRTRRRIFVDPHPKKFIKIARIQTKPRSTITIVET